MKRFCFFKCNFVALLTVYISVLTVACNNQDNETQWGENRDPAITNSYEENDTLAVAELPANIKMWMDFYQNLDPGFKNGNFKASGVILHMGAMPEASAQTNETTFRNLLAYSPDSTRIIDFWSFMQTIETGEEGNRVLIGGSPDQEVILVDKKQNTYRQLMYNGTQQIVEAADWINNNAFLIGMLNTNETSTVWIPELFLFNLQDSTFTNFRLDHEIQSDSIYFKNANFTEFWLNKKQISIQ